MKDEKKLNDQQVNDVSGGTRQLLFELKCERCGETFYGRPAQTLCAKCEKETKVIKTENGAHGGW